MELGELIEKILSAAMMPLGILVMAEELGLFMIPLFFDKALIGAILLILVQILSLVSLQMHSGLRAISFISAIILIIPSGAYLLMQEPLLKIVIGTMMFVEGMYAFH